jgi:hypothetical protein
MKTAPRYIAWTLSFAALVSPALAAPPEKAAQVAAPAPSAPPAPCTAPELHQFDFWVGEWDLTWPAQGQTPAGTGTNRIEKILGDCVIQENFAAAGPQALIGQSVSTYSVREKAWRQTWVDNQGEYISLSGGFKDGEMSLTQRGVGPNGTPRLARMTYLNIKPDSFDWHWESSFDGGKTWKLNWNVHYQRKGASPK